MMQADNLVYIYIYSPWPSASHDQKLKIGGQAVSAAERELESMAFREGRSTTEAVVDIYKNHVLF